MNSAELIGKVAARYLSLQLAAKGGDSEGTARFILDCLSAEQTASAARAVLADATLADAVEIKLPAHFLHEHALPASILTDRRATYFRNAPCDKSALLLANVGDDEQQSLKELVPVGAQQLLAHPEIWVEIASAGLESILTDEIRKRWGKSISGLRDLRMLSLERLSEYILRTRSGLLNEGYPLIDALGAALPALRMPRHTTYFRSLNEKTVNHASRWKALYEAYDRKFACYLQKLTPTQAALTEDDLVKSFERTHESIPDQWHDSVRAFISAPSGWNAQSAALGECEWEQIAPLFSGFKREKSNLGQATLEFYDEREPELLSSEEREYLELLSKRKSSTAYTEEDAAFFNNHRNELKEDRKLKAAWDKFVYGTPLETEDFLSGIVLCCERLFSREQACISRHLTIRCDRATKKDLRELNVSAGLYFARRYRGLKALFGRGVKWEVGSLFEFDELVEEWRATKKKASDSRARAALHLKFILQLEVEFEAGGSQTYSTQMHWQFSPDTVLNEFAGDWSRLVAHPFVCATAHREPSSGKGQFQSVDLSNVKTFIATYGKNRGSFIPVYKREHDLAWQWAENLRLASERETISEEIVHELRDRFDAFAKVYSAALKGLTEEGLNHSDLPEQLRAYTSLLNAVNHLVKGDRGRDLLLRPLLQIGAVEIQGGQTAVIVAPWHPLRMMAMVRKARIVAALLKQLLAAPEIDFGDARLFFYDLKQELAHPFYPEVVLGWQENHPALLALTDTVGDYTLHEPPVTSKEGFDDTNENPAAAATLVVDLVRRYLALHPHESANLSVVLYNCDSARLPYAVVDKLSVIYDDDEELRCQVILRHRDAKRLRALYEKIVEAADGDADSFNASEATRDFMARLRIGIMAEQASAASPSEGLPNDIVFSQDVIARHARLEWHAEDATPVELSNWIPPRWSRRKPTSTEDLKSVVYLCCPVQSAEGWTYLTAITSFLKGDWEGEITKRWLPARQLDFRDKATASIFEETHNLANWVVNYDELLDRRQLLNQEVRVIRYKQTETQGRNLIVSSKAPLSLLRAMVLSRVKALNLGLDEQAYQKLADKFIEDAKDISGDIVLRAARRGRNASELLGVVLSRYLTQHEFGEGKHFGWYFLDDYAEWLGQREEQIADLLMLCPQEAPDGSLKLAAVLTEAKYIEASSLTAQRHKSQKQLRDTIKRFNEALFGNPTRLDRELWLARLSDLLLDGVRFPASMGIALGRWRRALRDGACEISLRGYSHVFISGPDVAGEQSDFVPVAGCEDAYQEVFSRAQVRELVLRYLADQDPLEIRRQFADTDKQFILSKHFYRRPSGSPAKEATVHEKADESQETSVQERPTVNEERLAMLDTHAQVSEDLEPMPTSENENSVWSAPSIRTLLDEWAITEDSTSDELAWLKQTESRAKAALQQFQLQAKLLKSLLTPNAALLKFGGSDNLTVEQVLKRRSEFLTTHGLNIISVSPEPGVVSLALERPQRRIVQLPELWRRWRPATSGGNQELLIGVREADGELLFLAPGKRHAPHTLIAGSTGSGKSVLMQNILLSIAATNQSEEARIILIDPKQGVDYFAFDGLPHLEGGVIDNQEDALSRLQSLVSEMDRRYARFKTARASNLEAYNRRVAANVRLPVVWVIHDEFAEWMMIEEYKQEVTSLVGRLGVKARAAGLYLVFAAQRPDANVMPMQLRANLGNRLVLRVDSEGTSEIALGERGAERLLGRGHLLARLEGEALSYAQVPFIEEDILGRMIEAISMGHSILHTD